MRIGVFDSGIGGFSILREILAAVAGVQADYISDDAFAPYGTRSDEEIIQRSAELVSILLERGAELIVVACNSATAAAIGTLREKWPGIPFVGVEPYINVLNHLPNIDKAAVITTVLTGNSAKFRDLRDRLDPERRILHFSMPKLATITELIIASGLTAELRSELERELAPLGSRGLTHLILGCTHYPLIAGLIEDTLGVATISAAPYVARRVKSLLGDPGGEAAGGFSFMTTSTMKWEERSIQQLDHLMRYASGMKPWR